MSAKDHTARRRLHAIVAHLSTSVGEGSPLQPVSVAAEEDPVLLDLQDGIATITLNRPKNRNSMTEEVVQGLGKCVRRCQDDASVRCVVITGRGDSFCAGADFKKDTDSAAAAKSPYKSPWEKVRYETYGPFLSVLELGVPVIAAMNGHAISGGLGLALVCDIRVASETSKYGSNFVRLGITPGMGTTYILPRLIGLPKAAELIYTGRVVSGAEAEKLGLANYAVPQAQVLSRAMELAREISANAPLAVKWTKQALMQHAPFDPRPAALLEAHFQSRCFETADCKEGVTALLQKRSPKFSGS